MKRVGSVDEVWIVDDDAEMLSAIRLMLKVIGFETVEFPNARAAAQALLDGSCPDAMILDINMPEVTGLDMLEFVRRRAQWPDLPIVMLSTEAADITVDRALGLGADGYVTKPVTVEELQRALHSAIRKRRKGIL
jgi:two-component system, OmpR family, response regulator PrrA